MSVCSVLSVNVSALLTPGCLGVCVCVCVGVWVCVNICI